MANGLVHSIRAYFEANKSVRRVAEDPQLTAELILLVRMLFADGELKGDELEGFKRICANSFAIPKEDVPEVVKFLRDFGYETSSDNAALMFDELDTERKQMLLVHMLRLAKSDQQLHPREAELIRKTAAILRLSPEDMQRLGG